MTSQEIFENLETKFGDQIIDLTENVDPWIRVKPEAIADVCQYMLTDSDQEFETLLCLSGVA